MEEGMRQARFESRLTDNITMLRAEMGDSADFIVREIALADSRRAACFYLDGLVDATALRDNIIAAMLQPARVEPATLEALRSGWIEAGDVSVAGSVGEALAGIMSGSVLILLDEENAGLIVPIPGWEERSVAESETQPVIRGPHEAFVETIRTNTAMVRRRVKDARLRLVSVQAGTMTRTRVGVMYMQGIAEETVIDQVIGQLRGIRQDKVLESEYLERSLLGIKHWSVFPRVYNTDRPDTISAGIMEGRVAVFVDGTPFVLLLPSLFVDFIQSAEDYYQQSLYASLIRLLRYLGLFICMLAPSVYIALTTFHQDMIPTVLLLSLAAQREGVPFPAFVEALFMEVTFEILREAGLRMPRTIGPAVSIVGTIVIGQAAVEAGIVSAVMVIVVAITAISSFVIPSYSMAIAARMLRFGFMAMAALFGSFGLTIGIILLVVHLAMLNSFGVPYLRPFAPFGLKRQRDAILRFPYRNAGKSGEQGEGAT